MNRMFLIISDDTFWRNWLVIPVMLHDRPAEPYPQKTTDLTRQQYHPEKCCKITGAENLSILIQNFPDLLEQHVLFSRFVNMSPGSFS